MNIWTWFAIGITGLLALFAGYVWGFWDGCEHASEEITDELVSWADVMDNKYSQDEEKK
jgi:hypothetical protein